MPKLVDITRLLKIIVQGLESWNQPDAALVQGVSAYSIPLPLLQRFVGGRFMRPLPEASRTHVQTTKHIAAFLRRTAAVLRELGQKFRHRLVGLIENSDEITGQHAVLHREIAY